VIGVSDGSGKVTDHTFITAMGLLRVGYDTIIGSVEPGLKDKINKLLRI
jgi:cell division protein FtsA